MLDGERTKSTQLNSVATRQSCNDLVENSIHNVLDIPLIEVRVVLGDALDEFGFDH
jgi:hypothetical protein